MFPSKVFPIKAVRHRLLNFRSKVLYLQTSLPWTLYIYMCVYIYISIYLCIYISISISIDRYKDMVYNRFDGVSTSFVNPL